MRIGSARMVLYLAVSVFVTGTVIHGIAWSEFQRIFEHVVERPSGALSLRFVIQPTTSSIFALRDGIKDARTGRSPYFWTAFSNPEKRKARLIEGLDATGKIILIALALDALYQYIAYKISIRAKRCPSPSFSASFRICCCAVRAKESRARRATE